MKAISDSKLLSRAYNVNVMAVPDENTGLAGANENIAESALVDVDAGCRIKEEDVALFTVGYLELLHVQLAGTFNFLLEPAIFEHEVLSLQLLFCLHCSEH